MSFIKFSILILSIPSRLDSLKALYAKLEDQIAGRLDIEVLTLVDNKRLTIGEKRTLALSMSRGLYVAFLDDDDAIDDSYVAEIMKAIDSQKETQADVITFWQKCDVNGNVFWVDFGLKHPHEPALVKKEPDGSWATIKRPPYHMCVWKGVIARNTPFPPISYGEDLAWVQQMCLRSKTEHRIPATLHYYQYSDKTSESIQFAGKS